MASMFALVFQEPLVNVGSLACKKLERDGEPYRWFIPAGSPVTGGINQQLSGFFLTAIQIYFHSNFIFILPIYSPQ